MAVHLSRWRSSLIAVVLLVAGLLGTGAVRAQSIVYVDQNATGPVHDGSGWCQAYLGLSEAIEAALELDTIRVADGTYRPDTTGLEDPRDATFSMRSRLRIEGGYAGCGAPDPDERNIGLYETILSGDLQGNDSSPEDSDCFEPHDTPGCEPTACQSAVCLVEPFCCEVDFWPSYCVALAVAYCFEQSGGVSDNAYHVVTAVEANASAVLEGFTVTAGLARKTLYTSEASGGGIYIVGGNPRISKCTITGNSAFYMGGGIGVYLGDPRIADSTIVSNRLWAGAGGGIGVEHGGSTITRTVLQNNRASSTGGGLYGTYSTITLTSCTIDNNRARRGAGLAFDSSASVIVEDSVISGNIASGSAGALDLWFSGLTMTDSTISGNACGGSGCAMDGYGGYGKLTRCKIIGNGFSNGSSSTGGIIWDAAYVLVENSVIAGNIGESGGGLSVLDGALDVIGSTIAYNVTVESGRGAGVYVSNGYLTVQNSILWGNNAGGKLHANAQIDPPWPIDPYFTMLYTCVQGWPGYFNGVGHFDRDPMFIDPEGPDGIRGTEDDDLRLSSDSPYINWGDPAFIPAEGEVDLDGQPRLQGCRVDLGAFETNTEQLPADFDGDDDIDLEDFARFQDCFHAEVHNPDWRDTCLCVFDTFEDSAVDASDTVGFWGAMTDPG